MERLFAVDVEPRSKAGRDNGDGGSGGGEG